MGAALLGSLLAGAAGAQTVAPLAGLAVAAPAEAQVETPSADPASGASAAAPEPARFVAGFELTARSDAFGGLSGLWVSGAALVAVTDRGQWARFDLERDPSGRLIGVGRTARLEPIRDAGRQPVEGGSADAEGLAVGPGGRLWASFERGHRIVGYNAVGGAAQAEVAQLPISGLASNGGVEGLAVLPDGALLAVVEEPLRAEARAGAGFAAAPEDAIVGWRLTGGRATGFWIPRLDGFAATGADIGPDGAFYLLERRYRFWSGVRMRIRRFAPHAVRALTAHRGGQALGLGAGAVVAELGPSGPVDNFEAISVERRAAGGLWLFLLSDDNFSAAQRTLLLQYRYDPP